MMGGLTMTEVWSALLVAASAFVLLSNAAEKMAKAYRTMKAPNAKQDERLDAVEEHLKEGDRFLGMDKKRLDSIEDGNRATQRALLALLDHGIDGNNITQMQHAKEELQNHLINR